MRRSHKTTIPRRKTKRVRRGAPVSVYLDFDLLQAIRAWAEHEHMNFNDAVRDILFTGASTIRDIQRSIERSRAR